ncbi:hypothetical protein MKEN_00435500 [Mycena kentingensis (nom. inval.)]|nr:hypothetical protein MKEN_00435500 [Mycena kentingensis (nom. inval.)]
MPVMALPDAPRLSEFEQESIITLLNSVRDSRFGSLDEHNEFLVDSANSVLRYRDQVASFAEVPVVGECVFAIRGAMLKNDFRTRGPFGSIFSDILGFASAITSARKTFRERKRAADERKREAILAANRRERIEALEYARNLEKWQNSASRDPPSDAESEDTISLGSAPPSPSKDTEVEPAEERALPEAGPQSPIQAALSPLVGLTHLMCGVSLTAPTSPPPSPTDSMPSLLTASSSSSSSPSQPDQGWTGFYAARAHLFRKSVLGVTKVPSSPLARARIIRDPRSPPVFHNTLGAFRRLPGPLVSVPPSRNSEDTSSDSMPASTALIASGSTRNGSSTRSSRRNRARAARRRAAKAKKMAQLVVKTAPTRSTNPCGFCSLGGHSVQMCPDLVVY